MHSEWLRRGLERVKPEGKTQAGLAKILGVDPSVISKMIAGKRRIQADEAIKIAEYLAEVPPARARTFDSAPLFKHGKVAAGVWREAETATGEPEPVPVPRDPRFPHVQQYALEVEGDSVNLVAKDGWMVICVPYWEVRREITTGDLVHVERKAKDGKVEATLKRVRLTRNGPELWPESSSPQHQRPVPAVSSKGQEVEIIGLVIWVGNPNP